MKAWIEWDDDPINHIVVEDYYDLDEENQPKRYFIKSRQNPWFFRSNQGKLRISESFFSKLEEFLTRGQ